VPLLLNLFAIRVDTQSAGDRIGAVPEEKATRGASRYDAVIATLVGFCALCVSGYTAYMQRQQVRAAVWPILEFDSSNGPIRFTLANKGVGPAIIKHVVVRVDDQPVKNWADVLQKILGPGYHPGEESDMSGRVFAAGESMNVFTPHDDAQNPIPFDKSNPLWAKLDTGRSRVTVEICYCSTVGECWTMRGGGTTPSTTTPTRHCRAPSAIAFQQ
jgi:hypothetical protein